MHEKASGILRIFGVAPGTDRPPPRAQLSRREEEVADLVAQGLSNTAVGRWPFLSPATVANHVSRILGKLGFSCRMEMAASVVEQRLPEQTNRPPGPA